MRMTCLICITVAVAALAGCNTPKLQDTTPQTQTAAPVIRPAVPDNQRIIMSGYGKAFYAADICDISFQVITKAGEDLAQSFDEHMAKTAEISTFMNSYGDANTICAETATVLQRQNESYVYQTDYSARVPVKEDVAILQRELIGRGVNRIVSMELRSSKYNELLKQCRDLAIDDARSKVDYIASVTNREILDLIEVDLTTENVNSWRYGTPPQAVMYGERARSMNDSQSSFETYVDVTIKATFLLQRNTEHGA